MTDTRRKRDDAIKTLADMKARCFVDEHGCWIWRFAIHKRKKGSPVPVAYGVPPFVEHPGPVPAARLAWILSGKPLGDGQVVWRSKCANASCINPDHRTASTKQQMHKALAASGRLKGNPERAAINARNRLGMVKSVAVVRQAEAMFKAGMLQKDVRAALGLASKTAKCIREGRHPHSAGRAHVAKQASVFAWAASAAYQEGTS